MRIIGLCALIGLGLVSIAGAVEHPVSVLGHVYVDRNCNGVIDSADVLVNGVSISLQKQSGAVVGIAQTGEFGAQGVYAFPSDMAPVAPVTSNPYTLTLLLPNGYTAKNSFPGPSSVKVSKSSLKFTLPDTATGTSSSYDFLITQASCFYTDDQCGWGRAPSCNGSTFLSQNYTDVYGSMGVKIGGTNALTFTSARAIQNFLPQSGSAKVLTATATNSTNSHLSSLAGEVLAVKLAVDFSDVGVTTAFFGEQHILRGPLAGKTVREALALANDVLGGNTSALPAGVTLSKLQKVMAAINGSYKGGCDCTCSCNDDDDDDGHGDHDGGDHDGGCHDGDHGHDGDHDGHDGHGDDHNRAYLGW